MTCKCDDQCKCVSYLNIQSKAIYLHFPGIVYYLGFLMLYLIDGLQATNLN